MAGQLARTLCLHSQAALTEVRKGGNSFFWINSSQGACPDDAKQLANKDHSRDGVGVAKIKGGTLVMLGGGGANSTGAHFFFFFFGGGGGRDAWIVRIAGGSCVQFVAHRAAMPPCLAPSHKISRHTGMKHLPQPRKATYLARVSEEREHTLRDSFLRQQARQVVQQAQRPVG